MSGDTNIITTQPEAKLLRSIAKEIAMDIIDIPTIQTRYNIKAEQWEAIVNTRYFQACLEEETLTWQGSPNVGERVKLKYLTMLEESAEEMFLRLLDGKESLAAKTELLKHMAKVSGLGVAAGGAEDIGGRISININMGADAQLRVEKDVTPRVIEGAVL